VVVKKLVIKWTGEEVRVIEPAKLATGETLKPHPKHGQLLLIEVVETGYRTTAYEDELEERDKGEA
jgi:hypothetical protein